jgi:hypothetical protein
MHSRLWPGGKKRASLHNSILDCSDVAYEYGPNCAFKRAERTMAPALRRVLPILEFVAFAAMSFLLVFFIVSVILGDIRP